MSETTKATIILGYDGGAQTIDLTCFRVEGDFLYEESDYFAPFARLRPRRIRGIRLDFLELERDENGNYATFQMGGGGAVTVYIGEPGSDDIATFLPLGYLNSLDWEPMDCELPKWDAPLLGEQSFEVTIDFIDRSLMSILLGLDLNLHNEIVCDFTGIVSHGCSHCAKLPWEPEGGIQWD